MKEKLVLGLSGGVDSAVAATRLKEMYDVTCVYLDIGLGVGREDARALAEKMGLDFRAVDIKDELEEFVCKDFESEYLLGRTPLPCARCNPFVKFPQLAKVADEIGAKWLATGHYARSKVLENGRTALLRGLSKNDQSYMLAQLPQEILSRIVFPLGDHEKLETRDVAKDEGLHVADKPDSMDICFVPDGNYAKWMNDRGQQPPKGNFVDPTGKVLATHEGIHHYTIGQGRGLGVAGPHRYFVSDIRPETNEVVLSDGSDLMASQVWCSRPNWITIEKWTEPIEATVRFRHSKIESKAIIHQEGDEIRVELVEPARAPTPGQLATYYQGEVVVGSSWIERSESVK